jgi:hypothetical protein
MTASVMEVHPEDSLDARQCPRIDLRGEAQRSATARWLDALRCCRAQSGAGHRSGARKPLAPLAYPAPKSLCVDRVSSSIVPPHPRAMGAQHACLLVRADCRFHPC